MIGTIYRITLASGSVVTGRVQGSGGMLGGAGPWKTPRLAQRGLAFLQENAKYGWGPEQRFDPVRVYPDFTAESNGPHVDVDIRGGEGGDRRRRHRRESRAMIRSICRSCGAPRQSTCLQHTIYLAARLRLHVAQYRRRNDSIERKYQTEKPTP